MVGLPGRLTPRTCAWMGSLRSAEPCKPDVLTQLVRLPRPPSSSDRVIRPAVLAWVPGSDKVSETPAWTEAVPACTPTLAMPNLAAALMDGADSSTWPEIRGWLPLELTR